MHDRLRQTLPCWMKWKVSPTQEIWPQLAAFGYVTVVATAIAFAAWFAGLKHLPAGTVGLLGLLNPVTGVLLGTLAAGDSLTARQLLGIALVLVGLLLGQPLVARRLRARRRVSPATP